MRKIGFIIAAMILGIIGISAQTDKGKDIDYYEDFEVTKGIHAFYCPNGERAYPYYSITISYTPAKEDKYVNCDVEDGSMRYEIAPGYINFDRYEKNDTERTIKFYKKENMHILTIQFIEHNKFTIKEVGDWMLPDSNQLKKLGNDEIEKEYYNNGALDRFYDGDFDEFGRVYTVDW